MPTRHAKAIWEGTLVEGKGTMEFGSGAFSGKYSYLSRFKDGPGTNPEELLGAAHAGCYSMFLGKLLGDAGMPANKLETKAAVTIETGDAGVFITKIALKLEADVPGIDNDKFMELANQAKAECPISKAVASVETITLDAKLR